MTFDTVRRMLHETREQGYSVIPGILAPGYWGIGVAVLRPDGEPVAAVVLIAAASRLSGARQAVIAARLQRLSQDLMLAPGES